VLTSRLFLIGHHLNRPDNFLYGFPFFKSSLLPPFRRHGAPPGPRCFLHRYPPPGSGYHLRVWSFSTPRCFSQLNFTVPKSNGTPAFFNAAIVAYLRSRATLPRLLPFPCRIWSPNPPGQLLRSCFFFFRTFIFSPCPLFFKSDVRGVGLHGLEFIT